MSRTIVCCALALCFGSAAGSFAATSTAPNPVATFSSPGTKQVELQVCNTGGCTTVIHTVTVLDPMPSATSIDVTPVVVPQGSTVGFSATGAGQPPLAFRWRVVAAVGGSTVATLLGATVSWTAVDPPGVYNVFLDVSNASGTFTSVPTVVTVAASTFIFGDGFEVGLSRWVAAP